MNKKYLVREASLNIKDDYIKLSNTFAVNLDKTFHRRAVLVCTKGQYMKVLDTLAGNVNSNFLGKVILLNT